MNKLVTIGVPIYRRLEYIPQVLRIVAAQDYPNIELLISDNGVNGSKVHELVEKHYSGRSRVRQNPSTVPMSIHFNQIIQEASGEYFVLLADDDEISSNYVSELVSLLERHPRASVAMALLETVDEAGKILGRSSEVMPEILSGPDFVRAIWGTHEFGYESVSTFLSRTAQLKARGGFPDFWKGRGNDDALTVKLCLDNFVCLTSRCVFRKRIYAASYGFSNSTRDLARGMNDFLQYLDSDPVMVRFAQDHPDAWSNTKRLLVDMIWKTYYSTWMQRDKTGLSRVQWAQAGFALPFIPAYYKAVALTLASTAWLTVKKRLPWAQDTYSAAKARRS